MVIVIAPGFDGSADLGEAQKVMLVKALVAQTAVERFSECILDRLARRDVVPVEPSDRPAQHRHTGQLAAVIAGDHFWAPHVPSPNAPVRAPRARHRSRYRPPWPGIRG